MKYLFILFVFSSFFVQANMASPRYDGSRGLKSISSRDIDILGEELIINIDSTFEEAEFVVKYKIYSKKSGVQMPLLFVVLGNFYGDFTVTYDGINVEILDVPFGWVEDDPALLNGFSDTWLFQNKTPTEELLVFKDSLGEMDERYQLDELEYFETDIDSGVHEIIIRYMGEPNVDRSELVKRYEYLYSLSPVLYWKSFQGIKITVNSPVSVDSLKVNVNPTKIVGQHQLIFEFDSLPANTLSIVYHPNLNPTVEKLVRFGRWNIAIVVGGLLFLLHVLLVWLYRLKFNHNYSVVVILGSLLVPFLFLCTYMFTYDFIDDMIGMHASKYHGYYVLSIVFYPVIVPVYWLVTWLLDRRWKRAIESDKSIK